MKKLLFLALWFMPFLANSQDFIILKNGITMNCKITRMDSLNIYFNFRRNNQELTSFIAKTEVKNYTLYYSKDSLNIHDNPGYTKQFLPDTIKLANRWNNIITYSGKYGLAASGWSLEYYGYRIHEGKYWIVPWGFEFEKLLIGQEYFDDYNRAAKLNYMMVGISPFRQLNDYFYFNMGFKLAVGREQITHRYGIQTNDFLFGAVISEGIYFIPKSNFGLTCGLGLFEKAFYSKVYPQDIGFKWEIGFKF